MIIQVIGWGIISAGVLIIIDMAYVMKRQYYTDVDKL
jgi:hypothetical protein